MCSMCSGKGGYYIEPYIYSGDNTKVWKECSVMARNLANIVGGEDMLDEMMVLL